MITIAKVKAHIKRRNKTGRRYDWLGFVENKDLHPDVENLFSFSSVAFDWVNGNSNLTELINEVSAGTPFNPN